MVLVFVRGKFRLLSYLRWTTRELVRQFAV